MAKAKTADQEQKRPMGRPPKYSDELAEYILDGIEKGQSLREILEPEGMPSLGTWFRWLSEKEDLRDKYRARKEAQLEAFGEQLIEMSDKALGLPSEGVAAVKLAVNTRQWVLSKLLPKKYGDKLGVDHSGSIGVIQLDRADSEA